MKRRSGKFLICLGAVTAAAAAIYLSLAFYYRDGFGLNTWINGVYCTGKTVEEVNRELLRNMEIPVLTVTDRTGAVYELSLAQADFQGDYEQPLSGFLERQNPLLWAGSLFSRREHRVNPAAGYDRALLLSQWEALPFVREAREKERRVEMRLTPEGYELYDGKTARLDPDKGFSLLEEAVSKGEYSLLLEESGAYETSALTPEEQKILALWEKVEGFQDCRIVYDMGDKLVPVDAGRACRFLETDDSGMPVLDGDGSLIFRPEGVEAFVRQLAEEYDTWKKDRSFAATGGGTVTVRGGTYGTQLDQEAETAYLTEAFLAGREEIHIPAYKRRGIVRGRDDIGDTYIEIDMGGQKMYYYRDGECLVETDVVTGNLGRGMGTPEGVNFVYNKEKNRVLRGPGYASLVKFWMPVNGGIGIHDADWRSKFGGEIYKKSGSHGCINTPYEKMERLYDLAEIGTPVIMYY